MRIDLYLEIFAYAILHPELKDYDGIGIVVQAYQKRAFKVIDFVVKLAQDSSKKIPIRLVKGAYWDSEIKKAQELGLSDYHLYTRNKSLVVVVVY